MPQLYLYVKQVEDSENICGVLLVFVKALPLTYINLTDTPNLHTTPLPFLLCGIVVYIKNGTSDESLTFRLLYMYPTARML